MGCLFHFVFPVASLAFPNVSKPIFSSVFYVRLVGPLRIIDLNYRLP